ncbi:MAG: hypothetical protein LC114_14685 [Bryobacterales bacterium]|nr:hypothetical protein [Bryobacterales bacterium]
MNIFVKLDKRMAVDYLRHANTSTPDGLQSHYLNLRSTMDLVRKLMWIPMLLGCMQIAVGMIGLIIVIGAVLFIPGGFFLGAGWWLRNRLRQNLIVLDAAFRDFSGMQTTAVSAASQPV